MRQPFTVVSLCLAALGALAPAYAELTGTLKKIKESGAIAIGYRESSIPFSYIDSRGEPVGYAVELCKRVVKVLESELDLDGLRVDPHFVTPEDRFRLMQGGTIDMECASTTNSLERQKVVSFSVSYFVTDVRMVVRKDSGFKALIDLDGKPVVTTVGTTADKLVREFERAASIDV